MRLNLQSMAEFSQCCHGIVLTAREQAAGLLPTWRSQVDGLLCAALANMSATCGPHLATCFAQADQEQMVQLQVQSKLVSLFVKT
jgi:hypothetical protein